MSDEDEIRALLGERVAAMRDRDAARAVATLAPGVVGFELGPPLRLGEEQRDPAALEAWFAGWAGPVEIGLAELAIAVGGDVAYSHSLNRLRGTRTDGREVDFWMRSTLGFRKIDGAWKIAHGHSSVPFAMDGSFRALLDLKP
jgi:ketosteroid isomerase-like protein